MNGHVIAARRSSYLLRELIYANCAYLNAFVLVVSEGAIGRYSVK